MNTQKLTVGSPQFAQNSAGLSIEAQMAIDESLEILARGKRAWVELSISDRLNILDEINRDMYAIAHDWVKACVEAKGVASCRFAQGEEWVFLAAIFRLLRLLRQSLEDIQQYGATRLRYLPKTGPEGQLIVPVFPYGLWDRLAYPGTTGDVWLPEGATIEDRAEFYRCSPHNGKLMLVLGAGNVSSLAPNDILHAMFVKGYVVVLKPNPVNAYLAPLLERGFRSLIERGFLQIVPGDIAEGAYLSHHPAVDALHLTGSDKTFESIVFGHGPSGVGRKLCHQPQLKKPFTAELGNVSPIIVVPGPWSPADTEAQAIKIATWLVINAGFNCLTPRVIIQAKNWENRSSLNQAISRQLALVDTRPAYYPGAMERQHQFLTANALSAQPEPAPVGHLPWTYISDVPATETDNICFKREAFCGLMAETALDAGTTVEFIDKAVNFANETLWGTLTATIVIHPRSLRDPDVMAAIERGVANLKYGTVVINQYGGYAFFLMTTSWGGYPGHDIYDIQSGIGVVNNVLMFDNPQKSVVRSPFQLMVDPLRLNFKHFDDFGRALSGLEYAFSVPKFMRMASLLLKP
jgi:hypothetical protein